MRANRTLAAIRTGADLWVGGVSLKKVAVDYDTPCYVIDETDVRRRCRDLRAAFGEGAVSFTAHAMSCQLWFFRQEPLA